MPSPVSLVSLCALLAFTGTFLLSTVDASPVIPHRIDFPQLHPRIAAPSNRTAGNSTCRGAVVSPSIFLADIDDACHDYIASLQTKPVATEALPVLYELQDKYTNCTIRRWFQTYPDAPDGFKTLGVGAWIPSFQAKATKANAQFKTGPPVKIEASKDGEYADFTPIFRDATKPFFDQVDGAHFAYCPSDPPNASWNKSALVLYKSFEVAATQYQRCSIQKPVEEVASCTTETVAKLQYLPNSLFVYGGGDSCENPAEMYIMAAALIIIDIGDLLYKMLFRRHKVIHQTFSWVEATRGLVQAFGKPLIFAYTLKAATLDTTVAFTLQALELLTPTGAALQSVVIGKYLSKGWGYQIMVIDSLCAFLGGAFIVLIQGSLFTTENGKSEQNENPITQTDQMRPVTIGLILSLGPWTLILAAIGITAILWQCVLPIALYRGDKKLVRLGWHAFLLYCLIFLTTSLTPVFALWEGCWKLYNSRRVSKLAPKGMTRKEKKEWKKSRTPEVFPLVRVFRSAAGDRWPVYLRKSFIYWTSSVLAVAAFVGRWIVLVKLMSLAGDAYCPGDLGKAVAATVLYHLGMVLLGYVLQYFGLGF